jgi:threonylcarbamoyladenosine tRNA methylthiotransferase MtaB
MRVQLKTLGCRLNEAELETWAREFQVAGYRVVDDTEEADLLVLNSCAVTQDATRKSRSLIRKLGRENPGAKIILSGCYATLEPDEAATLGVDLVVDNQEKHRLVALAREKLPPETMPAHSTDPEASALFRLGRHRAFIKVQDGCRYRCGYCIVTLARGEERSRTTAEIVSEIHAFEAQGIGEVVLTGVHLGGYGSDTGSSLTHLVETVLAKTQIPRIRLGSLEPWDLPQEFIALFKNDRLMPHLHLPLQSGADAVLKRMARRTRRADFLDLTARLRDGVPGINLTSDIIVGFPGETEAEWEQTLSLVDAVGFGDLHIFSYSPRPGTAAAAMTQRIPGNIQSERSRALHAIAKQQKHRAMQQWVGAVRPVLWEGSREIEGKLWISGYTPEFHRVGLWVDRETAAFLPYSIRETELTGLDASQECLTGLLKEPPHA